MIKESDIISFLQNRFPQFIGDDAAVLPFSSSESYVITKDILAEDIHFRISYFSPENLAHKALHVNLSDIASMGARPMYVLLGISIPLALDSYARAFLEHFANICKANNVILIGGDTTKSSDKLFISVTAIGVAKNDNIKLRSRAKTGDIICVAGDLGHAHLGLLALEKGLLNFKDALLRPTALTEEGVWLGEKDSVTAMMDISDGLFIDLTKLCEASQTSAEINLDYRTPAPEFESACKALDVEPLTTQLTGGEDYGLLFTVKPDEYKKIESEFNDIFGYKLKEIGRIAQGKGVSFLQKGSPIEMKLKPFSHFGEL